MWPHTTWTPKHDCCMQFVDPLHTWTAATPSSLPQPDNKVWLTVGVPLHPKGDG